MITPSQPDIGLPGELAPEPAVLTGALIGYARVSTAEQIHGRAELLTELPARLAEVTGEQVQEAAATLRADRRAVLELVPGGAR